MAVKQTTPEQTIVYDLEEIASHSEDIALASGPETAIMTSEQIATQVVRLALSETVRPLFEENPDRFPLVNMCIGELVQDVERHGDGVKRVKLIREMGGIAIETENGMKKNDSKITGLGRLFLEMVFKQNYSAGTDNDGIFRAHVFIPSDPIAQRAFPVRLAS